MNAPTANNYRFYDLAPSAGSFLEDVLLGLSRKQKTIPAKYFYDQRGSQLFEAICQLPEYYPTRTEIALMRSSAGEMAARIGPRSLLIEYGSGSSTKTPILLDALQPAGYLPIDISREHLAFSALRLADEHPHLPVRAICADYAKPFALPNCEDLSYARKVVYFPGSSIGNFDRRETDRFLRQLAGMLEPNGAALIGVDLKKDPAMLHAAYNDAAGVTAAFNLNLLARINRELGGDCVLDTFAHRAFYDVEHGRIEMHLVSQIDQTIGVAARKFAFRENETIHTEISCKYSVEEFQAMARAAGLQPAAVWTDPQQLFSVHYLMAANSR